MKTAEVLKAFSDGKLVGFIAEYRGFKGETLKWVDKKTGRAMTAPTLRHTVELANGDSVAVGERVADDFQIGAYVPPVKKGARVLVTLTGYQIDKGLIRANGAISALAD